MDQTLPSPNNTKKSRSFFFFGVIVIILLTVAAVLRVLTPQSQPIPATPFVSENRNKTTTVYEGVTYTGPEKNLPKQLDIAIADAPQTTEQKTLDTFIQNFHLVLDSDAPKDMPIWRANENMLYKDETSARYSFLAQSSQTLEDGRVDKDAAITAAQNFIKTYFPNLELSSQTDAIEYLDTHSFDIDAAPPEKANSVKVNFAYSINGFPLFFSKERDFPFQVMVNHANEIFRVDFFPQFIAPRVTGQRSVISLQTAVTQIQQGKAAVIAANFTKEQLKLAELKNVTLTDVSLEYRLDPSTQVIFPFFRFIGTATNEIGDNLTVEIITPAVATTTVVQ